LVVVIKSGRRERKGYAEDAKGIPKEIDNLKMNRIEIEKLFNFILPAFLLFSSFAPFAQPLRPLRPKSHPPLSFHVSPR
jgi:hypothetical protein